jgi:hypothetical protein
VFRKRLVGFHPARTELTCRPGTQPTSLAFNAPTNHAKQQQANSFRDLSALADSCRMPPAKRAGEENHPGRVNEPAGFNGPAACCQARIPVIAPVLSAYDSRWMPRHCNWVSQRLASGVPVLQWTCLPNFNVPPPPPATTSGRSLY